MDTIDYVLIELRRPETVLAAVCRETGLKYSWLWQFKDGRIPNPGARKIQKLYDHFRKVSPHDTAPEKEAA